MVEVKRNPNEELKHLMKRYQEQTCDNFSDQNYDLDDIRHHVLEVKVMLTQIIKLIEKEN